MKRRFRIFSIKRLLLSILLGFLIPLSYALMLSEVSDRTGKTAPEFMVAPFGWPRPLWIFLMGRQPKEGDLITGIIFLALCNVAVYGALIYVFLVTLALVRRKRAALPSPPLPEVLESDAASSG